MRLKKFVACLLVVLLASGGKASPFEELRGQIAEEGKKFDVQGSFGCKKNCPSDPVAIRGPRGFPGLDGPGAVYAFSSGILPALHIPATAGAGLVLDIADGSASSSSVHQLSEITETAFAFTAPRNGTIHGLFLNVVGSSSSTTNITVLAILRQATTTSGFVDTDLDASIVIPFSATSDTRFAADDRIDEVTVLQSERYVLQLRLNHSALLVAQANITMTVSAGLVFS